MGGGAGSSERCDLEGGLRGCLHGRVACGYPGVRVRLSYVQPNEERRRPGRPGSSRGVRNAPETADIVIVGAGASSAAMAWRLSGKGLKIVVLERGDWVDQHRSPSLRPDWELALQSEYHANPNIRRAPADYPVNEVDTPIKPAIFNAVGGGTIRWGAHFPRQHPSDFRVRSLDGVAVDWPLTYDDLVPYYDLNDRMMGVSGLAGDPANPDRAVRPNPPLPMCPATRALAGGFDELGWHWWPSDAAILSVDDANGRSACNSCGPCGLGCPRYARASVDVTYWRSAITAGIELRTGHVVRKLEMGKVGQVNLVRYINSNGHEGTISSQVVVVACNGLGSARLLLASGDGDRDGDGIANASGLVGRNLMLHPTAIVTGVFKEQLKSYRGPFASALYSQEFYESDRERGFVRGFQLQALRGQGPLSTALGGYMRRLPWGTGHHSRFVREFGRTVSLTVTCDDLPESENRVTLEPGNRDRWDMAIPRMYYRLGENTKRMIAFGIDRAREALEAAGARDVVVNPLARQAGFHMLGTARMGLDPKSSVVDADCRCHTVDNLMIIDGSVFPTASAVNPTPTIQAIALRAADRLLARLGMPQERAA
ncbi:MAG: GMC family oxidoreductase [Rhodospirillaceae bacterium]|nr:GMC family oxidoreductase [Rhodospirillaceae bacterium]